MNQSYVMESLRLGILIAAIAAALTIGACVGQDVGFHEGLKYQPRVEAK